MTTAARERYLFDRVGLKRREREEWRSRFDYTTSRPVEEPATRFFFHITVTNASNYSSDDAHARAIESIGISRFPNTGGSYNALVMPGGKLYELQPIGRRGAHTVNDKQWATCRTDGCISKGKPLTAPSWNLNVNSRACALARNIGDPVTAADIDAAARWAAAQILTGLAVRGCRWHGHRCCANKDCPGRIAFALIDDLQRKTEHYVAVGLAPPPKPPEEDMPLDPVNDQAAYNTLFLNALKNTAVKHELNHRIWYPASGLKDAAGNDIPLWKVLATIPALVGASRDQILAAITELDEDLPEGP